MNQVLFISGKNDNFFMMQNKVRIEHIEKWGSQRNWKTDKNFSNLRRLVQQGISILFRGNMGLDRKQGMNKSRQE